MLTRQSRLEALDDHLGELDAVLDGITQALKKGDEVRLVGFGTFAVKERAAELKKDRPVLVVCDQGRSAGPAAATLRAAGFAEVYVLAGGLAAWREAGLPLKK